MDAQVARREDPELAKLLERFVCVRAVEMEGVDLGLFQFDYDQSWHAFFLNADRTIYGRYGTRASSGADAGTDVSVKGFVRALEAALAVHAGYPANKASLAGKRGAPLDAREIRSFDIFKSRFAEEPPKGCAHCHHVWEAVRSVPRLAKKPLPDELMWPYPKPDRLGLTLDLDECATVRSVAPGSAAERAGFRAGDRVVTLAGQPMLSIADVQWVLQWTKAPADVAAVVDRGGESVPLTLRLDADWRRGEDVTWRPSTHAIRPFGWLAATPEQRRALKVADGVLCVRVTNVPGNGVAIRAGIAAGDFLVEVDGSDRPMSENVWLAYLQQKRLRGQNVNLTLIHQGRREKTRMQAP
jgi:membrane-associated protease RseP (regulator of RpoE activity)